MQNTWQTIRDRIARDIAEGTLSPGDQLPVEPELAARFGTGRHSVRRAVAELAKTGKLRVEQGRGTFVEDMPLISYSIGKRTRLRKNLLPQGYAINSDLIGFDTIEARQRVANALGLAVGAKVYQTRRITYANETPIAAGAIYHDCARFPDLPRRHEALSSMTETYRSYGIDDYTRASTTMYGRIAKPSEAKQLQQHPDMAVLVLRAVDALLDGTPISFSEVTWSASRVKFDIGGDDG